MIDRNIGKTRETKPHGHHKHGQKHEEAITREYREESEKRW